MRLINSNYTINSSFTSLISRFMLILVAFVARFICFRWWKIEQTLLSLVWMAIEHIALEQLPRCFRISKETSFVFPCILTALIIAYLWCIVIHGRSGRIGTHRKEISALSLNRRLIVVCKHVVAGKILLLRLLLLWLIVLRRLIILLLRSAETLVWSLKVQMCLIFWSKQSRKRLWLWTLYSVVLRSRYIWVLRLSLLWNLLILLLSIRCLCLGLVTIQNIQWIRKLLHHSFLHNSSCSLYFCLFRVF